MLLHGYKLDDTHVLAPLEDGCGAYSWWLFTFAAPMKPTEAADAASFICEIRQKEGVLWAMAPVDPESFDYNGMTFSECIANAAAS